MVEFWRKYIYTSLFTIEKCSSGIYSLIPVFVSSAVYRMLVVLPTVFSRLVTDFLRALVYFYREVENGANIGRMQHVLLNYPQRHAGKSPTGSYTSLLANANR